MRPPRSYTCQTPLHFNPRTHVGCDAVPSCRMVRLSCISIHAPTWGATNHQHRKRASQQFQSTHPRGVRQLSMIVSGRAVNFNPRTHVGCDSEPRATSSLTKISIHAPTWGATHKIYNDWYRDSNFNPRTHVGCDVQTANPSVNPTGISIHAPTWGATSVRGAMSFLPTNFNPRTHVGCDRRGHIHVKLLCISIHAPTWGATQFRPVGWCGSLAFQSTHPRGVRLPRQRCHLSSLLFQSTHPRGVRQSPDPSQYQFTKFQSTHPRGVRPPQDREAW